jgi:phage repressor protein C with HTH and peptisase S24 domain
MFLVKFGGGLLQGPQGFGAGVPLGTIDVAKNVVRQPLAVCQRLFPIAGSGLTDDRDGLFDQFHGPDHKRIIKRLSTVSRETAHNHTLAQLCASPDSAQMNAADSRRQALKRFMAAKGLKAKPWAAGAGLADGVVRNFLAGRASSLSGSTLEKLAKAADATVAELIGEKPREPRPGKDVVAIKSLEVRAGMGGGCEVAEEPEGPPFYFRRDWIEKLVGSEPSQLRVLTRLEGDSMSPTINSGDVALVLLPGVDTRFHSGSVYVLWDGQGLVVKRLESMVGETPRLRVISDNAAIYRPYEVDADGVRIIGRVIWRGGRI